MGIGRAEIITEARSWIGTPFHHQGRLKKNGGCDCIGFILGVCRELQIPCTKSDFAGSFLHEFDKTDYARIPRGNRLWKVLSDYLYEIPLNTIEVADILLIAFDKNPQHVALVSDYPNGLGIIHCFADVGRVVEHRLDNYWSGKIVSAFTFFKE